MKKGINIWSFQDGKSIKDCITVAKDAGFDGIELALNETGELSLEATDAEINEIKARLEDADLELAGLATGLYWDYPMTSDDENKRNKGIDICKKQIEIAGALGVDAILVIPGAVGVDFIPGAEVINYEVAYERASEAIESLVPYAESAGVAIAIENVWNKFLLSPLEMRQFIDQFKSDFVGSYFDVGNVTFSGYPEHWIEVLGSRIKRVHFKDYRRTAGGLHGFVDLLAGDVDYPLVAQTLQKVGYNNYVTAEMIPNYTHYTDQMIYNTSGAMDAILGRVKR
ncbi:sugar phosphate isomerase/epimerase family protein [Paenibacillus yanchengensis]|uniref:Sugar phosphate isomerase/epimerase family protein n=1 Tax=Paenibacillus yanchengensis TaxID=2035833 RepID=A0ABW4YJC3_9BACL